MQYFINRLKEASTWRGIVAVVTACGLSVSPELGEAIVGAGLALMGIIGVFFPDSKPAE